MEDFKNLTEVKTGSEEIFDGVILHVFKDTVALPNGNPAIREVIRHVGAVGVIPVTDDGKVIIERQFRYPLSSVITEIPAGKLDSFTEDRLSAAKRELEEETGYTAKEWVSWVTTTLPRPTAMSGSPCIWQRAWSLVSVIWTRMSF